MNQLCSLRALAVLLYGVATFLVISPVYSQPGDAEFEIGIGVENLSYSSEIPAFLVDDNIVTGLHSHRPILGTGDNSSAANAYSIYMKFKGAF